MTLTVPTSRPVTRAFKAAAEAAGLTVAEGTGKGLSAPYTVLSPSSPNLDGPLGDRFADAEHVMMVHHFGIGPEQAEFQADEASKAWLPGVTVEGRALLYVSREDSRPLDPDYSVDPPLFGIFEEYVIATTPS